jgi:hypothetical protein
MIPLIFDPLEALIQHDTAKKRNKQRRAIQVHLGLGSFRVAKALLILLVLTFSKKRQNDINVRNKRMMAIARFENTNSAKE